WKCTASAVIRWRRSRRGSGFRCRLRIAWFATPCCASPLRWTRGKRERREKEAASFRHEGEGPDGAGMAVDAGAGKRGGMTTEDRSDPLLEEALDRLLHLQASPGDAVLEEACARWAGR